MSRRRIWRGLLWTAAGALAVGLLLFALWWGPWLFTRHPQHGLTSDQELKAKNDVRTTLVQALAGLAVASGVVVTYRTYRQTQRDQTLRRAEEDRTYLLNLAGQVTDVFTKAVEQLGHVEAPVRLGGLHSLVRLAQDNPPRRQTVVDILCAYLRMPYEAPSLGGTQEGSDDASARNAAQELEVRQTAQRLLAEHLRFPDDGIRKAAPDLRSTTDRIYWPGISIDLTGASLVGLDVSDLAVKSAIFDRAAFVGDAIFSRAYIRRASFDDATFHSDVFFDGVTFAGHSSFSGAVFKGKARFGNLKKKTHFGAVADFAGAHFFGSAGFIGTNFERGADFDETAFDGYASFNRANFGGMAWFDGTKFGDKLSWDLVVFGAEASFDGMTVAGRTNGSPPRVLQLDNPKFAQERHWPTGWRVHPDENDPSTGTLVRDSGRPPGADN